MNRKNLVAATLAIGAMLGFLCTISFLAIRAVPVENKDFFNMALVALIGFVGTAFGYYLGSSMGSAHKNDIIAKPVFFGADYASGPDKTVAATVERGTSEAGYIRLPAAWFLCLAFAASLALTGCATTARGPRDTPLQTAGKSLLAAKTSIVTAATATDALCKTGTLKQDKCTLAKSAYEAAKPAYDTAVDAYLIMSTRGGDAADFGAALLRVQNLAAHLLLITAGGEQ